MHRQHWRIFVQTPSLSAYICPYAVMHVRARHVSARCADVTRVRAAAMPKGIRNAFWQPRCLFASAMPFGIGDAFWQQRCLLAAAMPFGIPNAFLHPQCKKALACHNAFWHSQCFLASPMQKGIGMSQCLFAFPMPFCIPSAKRHVGIHLDFKRQQ